MKYHVRVEVIAPANRVQFAFYYFLLFVEKHILSESSLDENCVC